MVDSGRLLNFVMLTDIIQEIDAVTKGHGLNIDEERIVLDIMLDRNKTRVNDLKAKDMMGRMPLGGLFQRLTKEAQKDEHFD